jgi:long-chain acyl-CoA synthetase
LIHDDTFAGVVGSLKTGVPVLEHLIHAGEGEPPEGSVPYEQLIETSSPMAHVEGPGSALAGIFYTGGTMGYPKGVMLSQDNMLWHAAGARAEGLGRPEDVYLHVAPMFHVTGFAVGMFYWHEGSRHVVVPQFKPAEIAALIKRESVTDVVLVPTMIQMLLNDPAVNGRDLSSLQRILYGGSPITEAVIDRVFEVLPDVEMFQAYGMTETAGGISILRPQHHRRALHPGQLRSAGQPLWTSLIRILDPDGAAVPRGQVGEITVRSPNVMMGYWGRERETAAVLRDGWMSTGDAGYFDDDGFLYVVDRLKDMIVTGGENVYSVEVENALASHPAVAMTAVIGVPHEKWGESVHAFVVRKPEQGVSAEELIAHCRACIADYKSPRSVSFMDSLPLSAAGKVLKNKLREPYWAGRERKI